MRALTTEMPAKQSIYSWPLASVIRAPSPLWTTTGSMAVKLVVT
jgi:hypothetical protein